jgi:hypothetical protein
LLAQSWISQSLDILPAEASTIFDGSHDEEHDDEADNYAVIKRWSAKDKSVDRLLRKKEIDRNALEEVPLHKKNSVLRKLKPVCLYREAYWEVDSSGEPSRYMKPKKLKRPPVSLFSGFERILLVSDYNPRRLGLILERMLRDGGVKSGRDARISKESQVRVLQGIGHQVAAYATAFEESSCVIAGKRVALMEILRSLAEFFRGQLESFDGIANIDPVGCFSISEEVADSNPSLCEMLRRAVWLGVIINTDIGTKANPLDGLMQRRTFRISYTLAPTLGLPLRASKSRGINHCLASKYPDLAMHSVTEKPRSGDEQPGLFEDPL